MCQRLKTILFRLENTQTCLVLHIKSEPATETESTRSCKLYLESERLLLLLLIDFVQTPPSGSGTAYQQGHTGQSGPSPTVWQRGHRGDRGPECGGVCWNSSDRWLPPSRETVQRCFWLLGGSTDRLPHGVDATKPALSPSGWDVTVRVDGADSCPELSLT